MEHDLDDTIIKRLRPLQPEIRLDDEDTIVRPRRPSGAGGRDAGAQPQATQPDPSTQHSAAAYSFVVNTHQPIGLDRPAYLGRRPSAPRIAPDARPRLVRVPSPLGEVSSTHLELRQQGRMVIATDLRSTNGTRVRLPGSAPVRLRQGESIVVTPGTVIEIGDGNEIEIHSLRRTSPSDQQYGALHS